VAPEDSLNEVADLGVGDLGHGGCAGVVKAAASLAEHFTNLAHTGSVFPGYELDHRAAPGWGLVPRRADGDRAEWHLVKGVFRGKFPPTKGGEKGW
jgi:hypothetical protein